MNGVAFSPDGTRLASSGADRLINVWDLSAKGISCLVVSSELEELMQICHRILIMKKGRLAGEMHPQDTSLHHLLAACMD